MSGTGQKNARLPGAIRRRRFRRKAHSRANFRIENKRSCCASGAPGRAKGDFSASSDQSGIVFVDAAHTAALNRARFLRALLALVFEAKPEPSGPSQPMMMSDRAERP